MKTQIEVQNEIKSFEDQINTWADASGNRMAYINRANYLTAGASRQSYNIALSTLKKQVKETIKNQQTRATVTVKIEINSEDYTKAQLQALAVKSGVAKSGTKAEIAQRINVNA